MSEISLEKRKKKEETLKLEWRDYIAFIIALLQTSLLPFILMMATLFVIVIIFSTI